MRNAQTSIAAFRQTGAARRVSCGWLARSVLISLLTWLAGPTPAAAQPLPSGNGNLPVMTRNLDEEMRPNLVMQHEVNLPPSSAGGGRTISRRNGGCDLVIVGAQHAAPLQSRFQP